MSDRALLLAMFATPAALVGLVAILRGYNILIWRPRDKEEPCAAPSDAGPAEE